MSKHKEKLEDLMFSIECAVSDIKHWVRNKVRFGLFTKNYHIEIKGLSPSWHDSDTLLLYTSFQILVDFVEEEGASMAIALEINGANTNLNNAQNGLIYLDAYINEPDDGDWHIKCQKVKDLYLWWTVTRPARVDPWEAVSASPENLFDYWAIPVKDRKAWEKNNPGFTKNYKLWKKQSAIADKQQELNYAEDELMLTELIKARSFLWT